VYIQNLNKHSPHKSTNTISPTVTSSRNPKAREPSNPVHTALNNPCRLLQELTRPQNETTNVNFQYRFSHRNSGQCRLQCELCITAGLLIPYRGDLCFGDDSGCVGILVLKCCQLNSACIQRLGPTIVQIQGVQMLTLIGGLFCVGFINLVGVVAGLWAQRLALSVGP
jgi:hypothetical protein